jgi:hypothetical protein
MVRKLKNGIYGPISGRTWAIEDSSWLGHQHMNHGPCMVCGITIAELNAGKDRVCRPENRQD